MDVFLYILVWVAIVFVMTRIGGAAHVMGHRQGNAGYGRPGRGGAARDGQGDAGQLRWIPPARDMDPVCGRTVDTDSAKPSVHRGHVYYFCSRECRERFECAPEHYVGPEAPTPSAQLEDGHA